MRCYWVAALLTAGYWVLGGQEVVAAEAVSVPEITINTESAPDMANWAAEAKSRCEKSYALMLETLGAEGYAPPKRIEIIFHNEKGRPLAGTAGNRIFCTAQWFIDHPDDYGAVVHEMCHVIQAYGGNHDAPGWVVEGVADYARWFQYEPADRRPRVDPQRAKYTDGYQTTAAFFDWIVRAKDRTFVKRLNEACRQGKYKEELFEQYAGRPLAQLWKEFLESQKP